MTDDRRDRGTATPAGRLLPRRDQRRGVRAAPEADAGGGGGGGPRAAATAAAVLAAAASGAPVQADPRPHQYPGVAGIPVPGIDPFTGARLAGWGRRAGALLLDSLIYIVSLIPAIALGIATRGPGNRGAGDLAAGSSSSSSSSSRSSTAGSMVGLFGATLGKIASGSGCGAPRTRAASVTPARSDAWRRCSSSASARCRCSSRTCGRSGTRGTRRSTTRWRAPRSS